MDTLIVIITGIIFILYALVMLQMVYTIQNEIDKLEQVTNTIIQQNAELLNQMKKRMKLLCDIEKSIDKLKRN